MLFDAVSARAATAREERLFSAAAAAFRDGNWSRAENAFTQFADDYPKSERRAEAILLRAQARYQQHNFMGAVELLVANVNRAVFLGDEYQYWIAEAYFQAGSYVAAAAAYDKLVNDFLNSPRRVEAVVGGATARARLGEWPQVIESLTKQDGVFARAVKKTPANEFVVGGLLLLGGAQLTQGDLPGAESSIAPLAAQKLDAALDWQVQHLRSRILLAQDRKEEAWRMSTNLTALATAASTASRSQMLAESTAFQAEILHSLNRHGDAIATLQENLAGNVPVESQREALLKIAGWSFALGRTEDAQKMLNKFLLEQTNAPARDIVLLALGELNLKQHTVDAQTNENGATHSVVTNRLQRAAARFDELLENFPLSPLAARAKLGKGWCLWLGEDVTNSLPLFKSAAQRLPYSEEQAVARFKWADAQLASSDFAGALTNYNFILENYAGLDSARTNLFEPALYQAARAALQAGDLDAASRAVAKILDWFPNGFVGDRSLLLVGQGYLQRNDAVKARELFKEIIKRWPESPLVSLVSLAIARTYERDGDWTSAVGLYDEWLAGHTNSRERPRAEFYRAWATSQSGRETNALALFTNFVVLNPTNELAHAAQSWVADYYFRQGDFYNAEINYKPIFLKWPKSDLAYEARMMAGRSALGWSSYMNAIEHFTNLTSDVKCPPELRKQALFAYGGTLMLLSEPAETNRQANLELASSVFNQIIQSNPTNENAALAWCEIGNCYLQLAAQGARFYDEATNNAYQQALNVPGAGVAVRSRAQIGLGIVLEKRAALATGGDQTALLKQALDNYLDVFYTDNLRDGEQPDSFWRKKAGLQALPLIGALGVADLNKFIAGMEKLFPPLKDSLEKKRAALLSVKK